MGVELYVITYLEETMRNTVFSIIAVCACLAWTASAQATAFSSQSIGGTTGLISTPTAQVAWDGNDFAVDGGVHYLKNGGTVSTTPKATICLFKRFEAGITYDMQKPESSDNNDLLAHAKFRFFPWNGTGKSNLAIGGNYQFIKQPDWNGKSNDYRCWQGYLAATYSGEFFGMPAETTLVFGKTFGDKEIVDSDNIDFSMGFDLQLLPSIFQGYLHWINDFANYGYSVDTRNINNAGVRACFNTGARLAVLKDSNRFKLNIDILYLDVLDSNRCFGMGVSGGLAF